MAELSDFHLLASKKKKKKKKKRKRELEDPEASTSSLWSSDPSFVLGGHEEERGKVLKKKEQKEVPDPQLDDTLVSMESEVTGKAGTVVLMRKKKRKHVPIEPDDGELRVSQEKSSGSPRTNVAEDLGDIEPVGERTPLKKKKRRRALFTEQTEGNTPNSGHLDQIQPSGLEDTQEELFTSMPLFQTPCSSVVSQGKKKRATHLDTPGKLGTEKKSRRKRKESCIEYSDATDGLESVDNTICDSQQHQSLPKQGAPKGNSKSTNSPTPDHGSEDILAPPEHPPSPESCMFNNPFVEPSQISSLDLATAIQELEMFIPNVRSLSVSTIKRLASRDLIRFKNFKQEGIAVRFGKFSQEENEQLKMNVEAFLEVSGIESAEKLFFPDRFPEEKLAINKLKANHLFGIRIAEGIPRPWRLVYYRARKIFDPQNNNKLYSKKEIKKLKKYQAMYGNNWKKISELMHRSSHSVQMKYSQIRSKPNSGPWSKEEIKQLIHAVEEVIRSKVQSLDSVLEKGNADTALLLMREHLYKDISWTQVEAKVGTRHWRQCKHKWLSIVTKRLTRGERMSCGPENLQVKIKLIERMYELNVEDANEIDWEDLSSAIGNVPPYYVQRRFYKLKAQYVPAWNEKHFPEIIDHLYKETLPQFKNQLRKRLDEVTAALNSCGARNSDRKRTYKFSDIFWFSDEDLDYSEESEEETLKSPSSEADAGGCQNSGSL